MVEIVDVDCPSHAYAAGIRGGDFLLEINGNNINDVLDYQWACERTSRLRMSLRIKRGAEEFIAKINTYRHFAKNRNDNFCLGLKFKSYLMDDKRRCSNNCIFCFINQLPPGLRDTLYFKDDDARLSFLQGNYVSLTNFTEGDVEKIVKMKLSLNVSVHTTNPELRVKMLRNRRADEVLAYLQRFAAAGCPINYQIVLCPGVNDGTELRRTLTDLTNLMSHNPLGAGSIAVVPIGVTRYNRENMRCFDRAEATEILQIVSFFSDNNKNIQAADELYLTARAELPRYDDYMGFPQYENGVGMWRYFEYEFTLSLANAEFEQKHTAFSVATGIAAKPLIESCCAEIMSISAYEINVYAIVNTFFGENVTVAGLITGRDLIEQLRGRKLGKVLIIPSNMTESTGKLFLDDITVEMAERQLNVKISQIDDASGFVAFFENFQD